MEIRSPQTYHILTNNEDYSVFSILSVMLISRKKISHRFPGSCSASGANRDKGYNR